MAEKTAPATEDKSTLAGFSDLSSEDFLNDIMETGVKSEAAPPADATKDDDKPAGDLELTDEQKKALEEKNKTDGAEGKAGDDKAGADKAATDKAAADQKAADIKAADDKIAAAEATLKAAKTDEEKKTAQAAIDAAKAEKEDLDDKPVVLEFKNQGDDAATADPDQYGWKELAKARNIEIEEDTQEAYDKAIDKLINDSREVALAKYKPEAQRFIEFLDAGGSVEAFIEPTKVVDGYLALPDVDLIVADLEARGWDQAKIDKKIEELTEKDRVDTTAQSLRDVLTAKRKEIIEGVQNTTISAASKAKERAEKAFITESKEIRSTLDKMPAFMETPISPKNRELIMKKYEKGEYDALFKKPEVIAKFLLYHEFGAQAESHLKAKAHEEAKLKYKRDRHNIPPVETGGGGGGNKREAGAGNQKPEGNWAALPEMSAE